MNDTNNFETSIKLFQASKYLQGLELIDLCIDKDPYNSVLYSNRALFMSEMGHIRQAMKDLNLSLQINSLNYVSYFNSFSLNVRINCLSHALQDLYCALSAIYLIAAKNTKSYDYVKKAVQYAENNSEARLLKGLMELQSGRFKEAYEDLVWACGIESDNNIFSEVRDLVKRIGDSNQSKNNQEISSSMSSQKRQGKRLYCSFTFDENANLETQIYTKLEEFNQIYDTITQNEGFKTEKIGESERSKFIFITKK